MARCQQRLKSSICAPLNNSGSFVGFADAALRRSFLLLICGGYAPFHAPGTLFGGASDPLLPHAAPSRSNVCSNSSPNLALLAVRFWHHPINHLVFRGNRRKPLVRVKKAELSYHPRTHEFQKYKSDLHKSMEVAIFRGARSPILWLRRSATMSFVFPLETDSAHTNPGSVA